MILKNPGKRFIWTVCLAICSFSMQAQKNYAVMVVDAKTGDAIKGAAIKIKSTGATVTTSPSGNVVITAPPDDSLMISFRGYNDRKISLVGQSVAISIAMEPIPKLVKIKPRKARS